MEIVFLKTRRKISALILVHLYGFVSRREELNIFLKEKNIKLIEDAAEALGVFYNNKPLGFNADIYIVV